MYARIESQQYMRDNGLRYTIIYEREHSYKYTSKSMWDWLHDQETSTYQLDMGSLQESSLIYVASGYRALFVVFLRQLKAYELRAVD